VAAGTPSPSVDGSPRALSDPYDTLGLAPVFELDPPTLERRHRELSRALHPDRYAGRPASERQRALGRAIEVNEAFRKLKDPVGRAEALLARHGRPVSEAASQPADPGLLMQVMEQREALGEARRSKDLAQVRALSRSVQAREQRVLAEMAKAFVQLPPDLAKIETLLGELRYQRRFLEEAASIEDDLDAKPA
jgi:molecular chaperone HscB